MTNFRPEYYVTVQRKNTGKYAGKQNYGKYFTLPAPLCKQYGIETGQVFKIKMGEGGAITLSKVNSKPVEAKVTYQEWLRKIGPFIPTEPPGKSPSQICLEAGVSHATCPAIWVRQAADDIGLERSEDPVSHRILWSRPATTRQENPTQKLKETKLTDLQYGALPLKSSEIKNELKQAPVAKVEAHGTLR